MDYKVVTTVVLAGVLTHEALCHHPEHSKMYHLPEAHYSMNVPMLSSVMASGTLTPMAYANGTLFVTGL